MVAGEMNDAAYVSERPATNGRKHWTPVPALMVICCAVCPRDRGVPSQVIASPLARPGPALLSRRPTPATVVLLLRNCFVGCLSPAGRGHFDHRLCFLCRRSRAFIAMASGVFVASSAARLICVRLTLNG